MATSSDEFCPGQAWAGERGRERCVECWVCFLSKEGRGNLDSPKLKHKGGQGLPVLVEGSQAPSLSSGASGAPCCPSVAPVTSLQRCYFPLGTGCAPAQH